MINEITSIEEYNEIKTASEKAPLYLLKHSTACPVSASAYRAIQSFSETRPDFPCYMVKVIESRPVSSHIAEDCEIRHQSPQILLLQKGEVTWHDSHMSITEDKLAEKAP